MNKGKNNKKALAWVLSLCMMLAMIPAIPAQTAEAAEAIVYDFTKAYDSTWTADKTISGGSEDTAWSTSVKCLATGTVAAPTSELWKDITYTYTSGKGSAPWQIAGVTMSGNNPSYSANNGASLSPDYGIINHIYNVTGYDPEIGILLNVEDGKQGKYNISLNYAAYSQDTGSCEYNAIFTLYKGTAASGTPLATQQKTINTNTSSLSFEDLSLGTFNFEGEYYLSIKLDCVTKALSKTSRVFTKNVTLTPIVSEYTFEMASADTNIADNFLEVGESGSATFTLYEDGVPVDAKISATSSNGNATVAVDGNKVTVTGVAPGTSDITVTASYNGTEKTFSPIKLRVLEENSQVFNFTNRFPEDKADGTVATTYGAYKSLNNDSALSDFAASLTYDSTKLIDSDPWKSSNVTLVGDNAATRLSKDHGIVVSVYKKNQAAEFGAVLNVENDGWYKLAASTQTYNPENGDADTTRTITIYKGDNAVDANKIVEFSVPRSRTSFYSGYINANETMLNRYQFEKGEYYVKVRIATGADAADKITRAMLVRNINLQPAAEPENSNIFGNCGAYVQNTTDGTYTATFLSGINSLGYSKVGFVVRVGGEIVATLETTEAYKSVAVEGAADALTPSSFNMSNDSSYVFLASHDNIPTTILTATFQPYAVSLDGSETIYGKEFTATYKPQ